MPRTTQPTENPSPIGDPPVHLSGELRGLWHEIALDTPTGAPSDKLAFELMVHLVRKLRRGELGAAEVGQLRSLMTSFGLTPDGRRQLKWAQLEPKASGC